VCVSVSVCMCVALLLATDLILWEVRLIVGQYSELSKVFNNLDFRMQHFVDSVLYRS
jgi:hypothetical protein